MRALRWGSPRRCGWHPPLPNPALAHCPAPHLLHAAACSAHRMPSGWGASFATLQPCKPPDLLPCVISATSQGKNLSPKAHTLLQPEEEEIIPLESKGHIIGYAASFQLLATLGPVSDLSYGLSLRDVGGCRVWT